MGFVDDKYVNVQSDKNIDVLSQPGLKADIEISEYGVTVNNNNPMAQHDYHIIIQAFESECSQWAEEDYATAYHYKDVYSTRNFSERVREQMNYYPGMHQTGGQPDEDPAYKHAEEMAQNRLNYWNNAMDSPGSFMAGLKSRQQDFDYAEIFGSDTDAKTRAENIGKLVTQCVPCFGRLLDIDGLLPNGDLLEVHLMNIKVRTNLLDQLMALLKDPGYYIDVCEIINMFAHLCPQDILAILALLTQYLAKLNLDIQFNLDFIVSLVGPMLSPFLDALSTWLDKWIQLILEPIICVVDHINETIAIAQTFKIPLSEASFSIDYETGAALPFHQNLSNEGAVGFTPDQGSWAGGELERFTTPDSQKYNPNVPSFPVEATDMAGEEIIEAWSPSFTEQEKEERAKKWAELREEERTKRQKVPAPLKGSTMGDGRRWSKDEDIANKDTLSWGGGYNPPEKQKEGSLGPTDKTKYLDMTSIVSSIVQIRNIIQSAIQYVKDWFTYITQMIYDLLGVDFGWMKKKMDNTILKSRLIQLIYLIKAIIEAVSKNGLKCGNNTNFDQAQLKFVLEDGLNKYTGSKFEVKDDGSIVMLPPSGKLPDAKDLSEKAKQQQDAKSGVGPVEVKEVTQKTTKSGIIIKNCLKDISTEEIQKVRSWIAEFEGRTG